MRKYDDIEELVSDMFDIVDVDEPVSVIADKDFVVAVMQEMLTYEDTIIEYCDIDILGYDREYFICLRYDNDDECYYICIDRIYDYNSEKYIGTCGYVLFHEDANSKALIDMQNNEMSFLTGHDWFVIGEDDSFEADDEDAIDEKAGVAAKENDEPKPFSHNKYVYRVNGVETDKETYEKFSKIFDSMFRDAFQ